MVDEFNTRSGEPTSGGTPSPPDFDKREYDAKQSPPFEHPHPEYHANPEAARLYRSIDRRTVDRRSTQWFAVGMLVLATILGGLLIWYLFGTANEIAEVVAPP